MPNEKMPRHRVELIGRQIIDVQVGDTGIGLTFEGDWRIGIWSDFQITNGGELVDISKIQILKRLVLKEFVGDSVDEHLVFDAVPPIELVVKIGDGHRVGREAMVVYGPDSYIAVWND